LEFDQTGFEDLAWWTQHNRKTALQIVKLIKEANPGDQIPRLKDEAD
jgi:Txe/YoeB family toxin of Txe-Axe toxin-antitoxin module